MWGVRSADCVCEAASGEPCTPDGDHLDRYVRAAQQGSIARQTLKAAVSRLEVIAPQAVVPSSTTTAGREGVQPGGRVVLGIGKMAVRDRELEAGA
jgi:hypothetical protein